jgi:hypothetical protein
MLAHRDLDVAMNSHAEPLAKSTRGRVNDALDSISAVLNHVDLYYFDATMGYRNVASYTDAESLLCIIRDGLQWDARRRAKLEGGLYDPDDWSSEAI